MKISLLNKILFDINDFGRGLDNLNDYMGLITIDLITFTRRQKFILVHLKTGRQHIELFVMNGLGFENRLKILGKGENAGYLNFLLLTCFERPLS